MKNPLVPLKTWADHAFLVLKAVDDAIDYRFEDHAVERFEALERRVALLEVGAQPAPTAKL